MMCALCDKQAQCDGGGNDIVIVSLGDIQVMAATAELEDLTLPL